MTVTPVPPAPPPQRRDLSRCRDCGQPIRFEATPRGRFRPVDPDTGESHFGVCPARPRRASPPTDHCHTCGSPRVAYVAPSGAGGHGHQWASRCRDCGRHRWLPEDFTPSPAEEPTGGAR